MSDGGPYRGWVVALVCGVLPVALLAVIVAVPAALWSRLPARVADHWTLTGAADGTASRLFPVVLCGAIAVLGTGLVWVGWAVTRRGASSSPRPARRQRAGGPAAAAVLIPAGLFVTAVNAASVIMVTAANLDSDGRRPASVGAVALPALVAGPDLIAGALGSAGPGVRGYRHGVASTGSPTRGRQHGAASTGSTALGRQHGPG